VARVDTSAQVLGVVLAGGVGERLGGDKARVALAGQPLIEYALAAFTEARIETVVVAKPGTQLPPLSVVAVREPAEPIHPLLGICTGLEHAGGRPVVACPCDMPLVEPETLRRLAQTEGTCATTANGRLQPLLARYEAADLPRLREALAESASATATLLTMAPTLTEISAEEALNVNTREDLTYVASIVTRAL